MSVDLLRRRREMMVAAQVAPSSNYIQDGLVFHLDSVDATASEWVDRIGGLAYTLYNTTTNNGGVVFDGTSSYGSCSSYTDVNYNEGTIEVVADSNSSCLNSACILAQPVKEKISLISYGSTSNRNLYVAYVINHQGTNADITGLHTISISSSYRYKDKVGCAVASGDYFGNSSLSGSYIGQKGNNSYKYKGTIYQIRIYNRILTEQEVLHNQGIDIAKYNIS